jgi:16S rRNA (cytosine1402-N4)-methyltransferase
VVGRLPSGDTTSSTSPLRPEDGATVSHDDDVAPPTPDFSHVPVLLDRVVELFRDVPPGWYVDATLGGGGHAAAVLAANPGLRLLGLDRDDVAIAAATRRLAPFGDRVEIVRTGFDRIADVVRERTDEGASAVLMDLGVSSPQLDVAERGFSYRAAAPLDMRMDRRQALSAMEVVNEYSYPELARVIREFGEERYANRIARAIVQARPVLDTEQLADLVREAIPAPARRSGGHPAKRTFQAIRIEVNRELEQLADALDGALSVLAPGGRLAVMSYHSLEDRMVKATLREASTGGCVCPPGLPCACGAEPTVRLLKRGAWTASAEEAETNRRAESVRLRAVERLSEQAS